MGQQQLVQLESSLRDKELEKANVQEKAREDMKKVHRRYGEVAQSREGELDELYKKIDTMQDQMGEIESARETEASRLHKQLGDMRKRYGDLQKARQTEVEAVSTKMKALETARADTKLERQ